MSAPVIEITDLCVERGETTILRDINWRVEKGEHWVILGANGSGKTSLLNVLLGYLPPTTGEIRVLGQEYGATDWRDLRAGIGVVGASVANRIQPEDLALGVVLGGPHGQPSYWGRPRPTERAEAMRRLADVECAKLVDRPWRILSQGERQRVLIGRALMASPALLLLDEPCAGLDPVAREHFLQFLERLAKRRRCPSIALVTHHVEEVMPFITHALLIREGEIAVAGSRRKALTSAHLGAALGVPVRLSRREGRYALTVSKASRGVV